MVCEYINSFITFPTYIWVFKIMLAELVTILQMYHYIFFQQ